MNKIVSKWLQLIPKTTSGRVLFAVVLIALAFVISRMVNGGDKVQTVEKVEKQKQVSLVTIGAESDLPSVSLVGSVGSQTDVTLRTESQGQVKKVYKKVGDKVRAGEIIAELENSRERAGVLQAQAALDTARAGSSIAGTGTDRDRKLYSEAESSAQNMLKSSYETMNDAVVSKLDKMIENPKSVSPSIRVSTTRSELATSVSASRVLIESILASLTTRAGLQYSGNNLVSELTKVQTELTTLRSYADNMVTIMNNALPSDALGAAEISSLQSQAVAARSQIAGQIQAVTGAKELLSSRASALAISESQSANSSFITTSQASIKQAQAGLMAAVSALEKTILRSPITGTINSLDITLGNLVNMYQVVGQVSNNGALEVVAYVTDRDLRYMKVGDKVQFENGEEGVITSRAPALDPRTKKAEIKIGVTSDSTKLVNGQSISFSIERNEPVGTEAERTIIVPITAIKILQDKMYVFTVDENSVLQKKEVERGSLIGSSIIIKSGLTEGDSIVRDARGLSEGETVTISE